MDSILNSVKKILGISDDDDAFDTDLVVFINSVFSSLNQLNVGPSTTFSITGPSETWNDFTNGDPKLNMVQAYMYIKVRIMFDPPASSVVMEAMKKVADEYEWRLNIACDKQEN